MKKYISLFIDFYLKHYLISLVTALVFFGFSVHFALKLTINSNQLDLLPDSLPAIEEARKINEMVGGTGYVIVTISHSEKDEGDAIMQEAIAQKVSGDDHGSEVTVRKAKEWDKEHLEQYKEKLPVLKNASDQLFEKISVMEDVGYIQHKFNLDFIQDRILYYWKTEDLKEAIRRVSIKRDELIEKANPFYIDLGQANYQLDISDLMEKYSRIGKQQIVDEYLVSPDRKMVIILIKPKFSLNEIELSRQFINKVKKQAAELELEKTGVDIGFTGAYVQYVDAYDSVKDSLEPTMLVSLTGISLILIVFIPRKRLILPMLLALIYGIGITFGVTYFILGQLNIITAIFGGILAGLGIDFGIHLIYRFQEEYGKHEDVITAVKEAVLHTGAAVIYTAGTTAGAFGVLMFSDFKGFSEFGMISAYGIIITAFSMLFITPLLMISVGHLFPSFYNYLKLKDSEKKSSVTEYNWFNFSKFARVAFPVVLVLSAAGAFFISSIRFDDDYRNILEADLPSEWLKQEVVYRYDMSSDPLGIVTENMEDTAALWEHIYPMTPEMEQWLDQVGSLYSFVPDGVQQRKNQILIEQFKRASSQVKYPLVPPEYREYWPRYQAVVNQKPFTYKDVPEHLASQFRNVPESRHKGYITTIYANTLKLNTADDIKELDALVGIIKYPVVGRGTIRRLAFELPAWERRTGRRISGDKTVKYNKELNLELSEYEENGVVEMANSLTKEEMEAMEFFPSVTERLLSGRPFKSIPEIMSVKKEAITTGPPILISKFIDTVRAESRTLLVLTGATVVLILLLSFRSVLSTVITLLPLATGLLIHAGAMVLLDIKLNYFNVVVFPILIGYGIDNGIFIYHRFLENGSVSHAVYTTGKAILASSLTTLVGWGSLYIATHPGIESMGLMSIVGLSIILISSLAVMPSLLQLIKEEKLPFSGAVLRMIKSQKHLH